MVDVVNSLTRVLPRVPPSHVATLRTCLARAVGVLAGLAGGAPVDVAAHVAHVGLLMSSEWAGPGLAMVEGATGEGGGYAMLSSVMTSASGPAKLGRVSVTGEVCRLVRRLLILGCEHAPAVGGALEGLLRIMTGGMGDGVEAAWKLRTEVLHVLTCALLGGGRKLSGL